VVEAACEEAMVGTPHIGPREGERVRKRKPLPVPSDEVVPATLDEVWSAVQACRRCDLWRGATQGVAGAGPGHASLMFVGEQPGDQEDRGGEPFVGPAGRLLDRALADAGVPRAETYVTNAVKHFKNEPRGKRRLHKTPDTGEVRACRWWLEHERRLVRPRVIVALGATAGLSVFGRKMSVMKERARPVPLEDGAVGFLTVHPSYMLRIREPADKEAAYRHFVEDLQAAWALLSA
jgi:DNA polymerase